MIEIDEIFILPLVSPHGAHTSNEKLENRAALHSARFPFRGPFIIRDAPPAPRGDFIVCATCVFAPRASIVSLKEILGPSLFYRGHAKRKESCGFFSLSVRTRVGIFYSSFFPSSLAAFWISLFCEVLALA